MFVTAVNGQVSGLLSKYLAAAAQNQAASSVSPTSPTGVSGVPGPHVGDLQRRKTEPALTNRNRVVSQHNSVPIAGGPDNISSNGSSRRPAKILSPHNSTEGISSGSICKNDHDAVSTDGTEETEIEYGKADGGTASCSSGASVVDKSKGHSMDNGGSNNINSRATLEEQVTDGQGCVVM